MLGSGLSFFRWVEMDGCRWSGWALSKVVSFWGWFEVVGFHRFRWVLVICQGHMFCPKAHLTLQELHFGCFTKGPLVLGFLLAFLC